MDSANRPDVTVVLDISIQRSRLQISNDSSAPAIMTSFFSPANSRSSGGTSVRPARSTRHSFALATMTRTTMLRRSGENGECWRRLSSTFSHSSSGNADTQ